MLHASNRTNTYSLAVEVGTWSAVLPPVWSTCFVVHWRWRSFNLQIRNHLSLRLLFGILLTSEPVEKFDELARVHFKWGVPEEYGGRFPWNSNDAKSGSNSHISTISVPEITPEKNQWNLVTLVKVVSDALNSLRGIPFPAVSQRQCVIHLACSKSFVSSEEQKSHNSIGISLSYPTPRMVITMEASGDLCAHIVFAETYKILELNPNIGFLKELLENARFGGLHRSESEPSGFKVHTFPLV